MFRWCCMFTSYSVSLGLVLYLCLILVSSLCLWSSVSDPQTSVPPIPSLLLPLLHVTPSHMNVDQLPIYLLLTTCTTPPWISAFSHAVSGDQRSIRIVSTRMFVSFNCTAGIFRPCTTQSILSKCNHKRCSRGPPPVWIEQPDQRCHAASVITFGSGFTTKCPPLIS